MSTPNIIDTTTRRRPAFKRTRTLAFRLNRYNTNNQAISVFQSRPSIEWKSIDFQQTDTATQATDTLHGPFLINAIAQGSTQAQHIGRKLTLRSVQYRFHTGLVAGGSTLAQAAMRVLIVYDRTPSGALPALADIFNPVTSFIGMQTLGNSDRFLIVMDRIHEPTSALSQNYGQGYRKVCLEQNFIGANADIASISTGALYIIYGHVGLGAANVINLVTRVRFTDQ